MVSRAISYQLLITVVILLTCICFLFSTSKAQNIYKWKDEKGQWHFSQSPRKTTPGAVFLISIEKLVEGNSNDIHVSGFVKNISSKSLRPPTVYIAAVDTSDNTIYKTDIDYPPIGLKGIEPNQQFVFSSYFFLPNEAKGRRVKFVVEIRDYPFIVRWQSNAKEELVVAR